MRLDTLDANFAIHARRRPPRPPGYSVYLDHGPPQPRAAGAAAANQTHRPMDAGTAFSTRPLTWP